MELKWLNKNEVYDLFKEEELHQQYVEKKFKYLDLSYRGIDSDLVLVAIVNKQVAGLLQLGKAPSDKNLYWMKYVTVHPDFRQQGVARNLIQEMFLYLLKIPEARVELSSYEKEGEVMIPMVQDLANQYPQLSVSHRTWGSPYLDAKHDFIRSGDTVWVDDAESGYQGWGEVMYFIEYKTPLKVMIKKKNKEEVLEVEPKFLTHNKK